MTEEEQLLTARQALIDYGACTLTDFANPDQIYQIVGLTKPKDDNFLFNKYTLFQYCSRPWVHGWMRGGVLDSQSTKKSSMSLQERKALQQLQTSAKSGDTDAQLDLAILYFLGLGEKRNFHKAEQLLKNVITKDVVQAKFYFGCLLLIMKTKPFEQAMSYLQSAADQDYLPAILALSLIHRELGNSTLDNEYENKAMQLNKPLSAELLARSYGLCAEYAQEDLLSPLTYFFYEQSNFSDEEKKDFSFMCCTKIFGNGLYSGKLTLDARIKLFPLILFPEDTCRGLIFRRGEEPITKQNELVENYKTTISTNKTLKVPKDPEEKYALAQSYVAQFTPYEISTKANAYRKKALELLLEVGDSGNGNAFYDAKQLLQCTRYEERNELETIFAISSEDLVEKAADLGHLDAMLELAESDLLDFYSQMAENEPAFYQERGLRLIQTLANTETDEADSAISHARYILGMYHAIGILGVEEDIEKAVFWWERACVPPYAHQNAALFLAAFYYLRSSSPEVLEEMFNKTLKSPNSTEDMRIAKEWLALAQDWSDFFD